MKPEQRKDLIALSFIAGVCLMVVTFWGFVQLAQARDTKAREDYYGWCPCAKVLNEHGFIPVEFQVRDFANVTEVKELCSNAGLYTPKA